MPNNAGFNGSTVSFPSTSAPVGSLRGISFDESAAEVDITASSDSLKKFVAGIPKSDVSLDLVGGSTAIVVGSTGALKITWKTGGTAGTLSKVVCVGRAIKGNMDGEITSTLKFAQST